MQSTQSLYDYAHFCRDDPNNRDNHVFGTDVLYIISIFSHPGPSLDMDVDFVIAISEIIGNVNIAETVIV
jgi:hypothetical protein